MAKTCVKCGYERRESDRGPDFACPACGVVYAKAEAAAARQAELKERVARAPVAMAAPPPSGEAEAMIRQVMAMQAGQKRGPSPYKGMALVALVAFAIGFASAAGLYSATQGMAKAQACKKAALPSDRGA
jgi:uncharacterized Zn finger protein (UPF0148 family)